jgi:hypothetical protein
MVRTLSVVVATEVFESGIWFFLIGRTLPTFGNKWTPLTVSWTPDRN